MNRRTFLEACTASAAAAKLVPRAAAQNGRPARRVGPNDAIRVAFIGTGSRARGTARAFAVQPDVSPVAACDCHRPRAEAAAKALGDRVEVFTDFRRVLDRKDVDAVSISTPDHWHALLAIAACEAGKDVYVEKPLSRTVVEGRAVVAAARRYERIVQGGTQCRSSPHFHKAAELVQSGRLGRVHKASAWIATQWGPSGVGRPADEAPPEGLDWEMWQGPAPRRPFNPARFERFRQFWDYAGGTATDRGVHLLDIVQMCLGIDAPATVASSGGRYVFDDSAETPDTQEIVYEVQRGKERLLMTWQHREANTAAIEGRTLGMAFFGSQGTLVADYAGFVLFPEGQREPAVTERGGLDDRVHVRNFLDCMRSRKLPVADVEICHRSTTTTLLGNIALRVGRKLTWDRQREQFVGDREANRLLAPRYTAPWKLPRGFRSS